MKQFIYSILLILSYGGICTASGVLVEETEDPICEHYLDEVFGIDSRIHLLPKDIQFYILSFLPNPFRPIRVTKCRQIFPTEEIRSYTHEPVLSVSGKEVVVVADKFLLREALDGSHRYEPVDLGVYVSSFAFNSDHTKMAVKSLHKFYEFTLNNYAFVGSVAIDIPQDINCIGVQLQYLPDEKVMIVNCQKDVLSWAPAVGTIERLWVEPDKGNYSKMPAIHPQGLNVVFAEDTYLRLFDCETREWHTVEGLELEEGDEFESVAYNNDGTVLLTHEYYKRDEEQCNRYRQLKLTGTTVEPSHLPVPVYFGASYSSNDHYLYCEQVATFDSWTAVKNGYFLEEETHVCYFYSSKSRVCLFTISEDDTFRLCLIDPSLRYMISSNQSNVHIWQLDPSWASLEEVFTRSNSLRQYLFIRYLHLLGRYGISLDEKGLKVFSKAKNKLSAIKRGPQKGQLDQLIEVYESFDDSTKGYLNRKYEAFEQDEKAISVFALLKLLTFIGAIGYAGSRVIDKYSSGEGDLQSSQSLDDFLVKDELIEVM